MLGSVAKTAGNHDLHFGGEFRVHRINFTQFGVPNGHFVPTDRNIRSTNPRRRFAGQFSGGRGYRLERVRDSRSPATQNLQYAGFVQDNWHVNDRLTLNLGLRYDVD